MRLRLQVRSYVQHELPLIHGTAEAVDRCYSTGIQAVFNFLDAFCALVDHARFAP